MKKTILWLFGIALSSRALIALLQIAFGINGQINLDQYLYGGFNAGFEIEHDFYYYYVAQLSELAKGLLPYKDFAYSYPPLFLYSLYAFYLLGHAYLASIPILLSDAATAVLVYLIVERFVSSRIAFLAGLSYAISPFFLLYEGYLWFSSQPMTFFLLLSLYLIALNKPVYSSMALAIAVAFKQEILFILPLFLFLYVKNYGANFYKGLMAFVGIFAVVSLPFLLLSPENYLASISYGIIGPSHLPMLYSSSQLTASAQSTTLPQYTLDCSTISNTWRSLICHYGSLTYTDHKYIPSLAVFFSSSFLNMIGLWLIVPFFGLIAFCVTKLRDIGDLLLVAMPTSLVGILVIFDVIIHPIYRYYLIPVYALILVLVRSKQSVVIATSIPVICLFLPSGSVQLLPPLISILIIIMTDYLKNMKYPIVFLQAHGHFGNTSNPLSFRKKDLRNKRSLTRIKQRCSNYYYLKLLARDKSE